jgi:hypothetical protein
MRRDAEAAGRDPDKVEPLPDWRLHDLRRTVATWMGELGVPPHTIGAVLNHDPKRYMGITSVYNRSQSLFERRRALTAWARFLRLALDEETWQLIAKLLRPETEADAAATDEFRRMIQSDTDAWDRYLAGLTQREDVENVVAIRSALP